MDNIYYRKKDSPCKGCSDRTEECHGECERYLSWSKEIKQEKDEILKTKLEDFLSRESEIKGHLKRKMDYRKRKGF